MAEAPSLRAFLRANPGAATGLERPGLIVLVIALGVAAIWGLVIVGTVMAWHANGWRGVGDLLVPYTFELLPLVAATGFAIWLAWDSVVLCWILGRGTWALSNDAWLAIAVRGERRLIPFDRIVEVKEYPADDLGFAFDDDELTTFYRTFQGRRVRDAAALRRAIVPRLDLMNFTIWERTAATDYKSPNVYRRVGYATPR